RAAAAAPRPHHPGSPDRLGDDRRRHRRVAGRVPASSADGREVAAHRAAVAGADRREAGSRRRRARRATARAGGGGGRSGAGGDRSAGEGGRRVRAREPAGPAGGLAGAPPGRRQARLHEAAGEGASACTIGQAAGDPAPGRRMGSRLALLAAVQLIAAAALVHDAAAEPRARELYKRGIEEYKAQKYEAAVASLKESYDLDPRPDALFALAQAERLGGRCPEARVHYKKLLESTTEVATAKAVQT